MKYVAARILAARLSGKGGYRAILELPNEELKEVKEPSQLEEAPIGSLLREEERGVVSLWEAMSLKGSRGWLLLEEAITWSEDQEVTSKGYLHDEEFMKLLILAPVGMSLIQQIRYLAREGKV